MRAPACIPSVVSCATWRLVGGVPAGPEACRTPSASPMKLTGTHTAETAPQGRPRSREQALSASLSAKTTGLPWRTAMQLKGDSTSHPGAPASGCCVARSRWARLERLDQLGAEGVPVRVGAPPSDDLILAIG